MGDSDQNSEREELASWLKMHETKFFFRKLLECKNDQLDEMTNLNSVSGELTKDFYRMQGVAMGYDYAYTLAHQLAKGE